MTAINFGVGTMIGRRTDIQNPTPAFFGILQEVEIDFDQSLKELIGQYRVAVDVAFATLKITGKAKFARIQANIMNDMFFGGTVEDASGDDMSVAEAHAVPATPYKVTVTNGGDFVNDLGVFNANTGLQMEAVAASPATGQYAVDSTTGEYTFAAADTLIPMLFYYSYTITTAKKITVTNPLLGTGPAFQLNIKEQYTNNAGVINTMFLKLNACRSSKLTLPFKNVDYTIQEFDFQAFADQANTIGSITVTE